MCFSELVLAGLGKAGAVYPMNSLCLVCTMGDLGCLVCVGAWGGLSCEFCWDVQLQLAEFREQQLLPVIFAPEKAAQHCVSTDCWMPVVARPFLSCSDLL